MKVALPNFILSALTQLIGRKNSYFYGLILSFVPALFASNNLLTEEPLFKGDSITSNNGKYVFSLQANGKLVLIETGRSNALWTAETSDQMTEFAILQGDGNLVLRNLEDNALWSSGTYQTQANRLTIHDNGLLALYADNRIVWQVKVDEVIAQESGAAHSELLVNEVLNRGDRLEAPNKRFQFNFQDDGNLVLVDTNSNSVLWATGTNGQNGVRAKLQGDGNFVLRKKNGNPIWSTKTGGTSARQLRLNNSGELALLGENEILWRINPQPEETSAITHVGTTKRWDSNGKGLEISRPAASREGDLLVMFLHRTDDYLPLSLPGWNRVAECLKGDNGMACVTERDCRNWADSQYCERFNNGSSGQDLAQAVYVRTVSRSEPNNYRFDLKSRKNNGGHPSWVFLSAIRGADNREPVRDWAHTGCDNDRDSKFPSVRGNKNDLLMLSQSFDDAEPAHKFQAPSGTRLLAHIGQSDESGFLFAGTLKKSGETGISETRGEGASACKDALISLVIRPR